MALSTPSSKFDLFMKSYFQWNFSFMQLPVRRGAIADLNFMHDQIIIYSAELDSKQTFSVHPAIGFRVVMKRCAFQMNSVKTQQNRAKHTIDMVGSARYKRAHLFSMEMVLICQILK